MAESGFALILALIISSVVLAIGVTLLDITVKQLNLGTTAKQSEVAFQAAAAGMDCLRWVRNQYPTQTQAGGSLTFDCIGQNITLSDSDGSATTQHFRIGSGAPYGVDWTSSGSTRCIDMEMFVYDATGSAIGPMYNGKTCPIGGVCSIAISRGYNRSCSGGDDLFTVQRELTAEF